MRVWYEIGKKENRAVDADAQAVLWAAVVNPINKAKGAVTLKAICTNQCLPLTRVRVSGGHRCEATAPTETAVERWHGFAVTEGEKG